ncbi:MAG TPA: ABC transporter substrate-binding protein [Dermatophilaceae bacterium]|nr:ABC transporter substrate-binding protein [Dermatophilaceae bacterium]
MIRPTRTWSAVAALATASLVLTACGSDSSSDKKSDGGTSTTAAKGDGTLTLGTLLPQTGDLAPLGPPEFAGVQVAVDEINKAGGYKGKDVVKVDSDSGDGTPDIAGASVDKLLAQNVDVVIGAASSNVSKSVIDKITGEGVVQFSPANTAAGFDTYPDKGLYFRTAPSDLLQGKVVANLAVQDGSKNVAVLARQDFYGEGLAKSATKNLEAAGANVAASVLYNADAENYTAEVNEIAAAKPDAIILVAFEETLKIIPQLIAKGLGPKDAKIYFVDGNLDLDFSKEKYDLTGMKGTAPAPAEEDPGFNKELKAIDPKIKAFTYSSEAYDTVMMSALAALAAGDDSGEAIASELVKVSKDGTQCSGWEECSKLVEDGEDIDYEGQSGPTDMNETGSLVKGTIGISQFKKGNTYEKIDSVTGLVE